MSGLELYPRYLLPAVQEALTDSPVALIHGPRQCGKTTLARQVGGKEGYGYFSFDDDVQRAAALADPKGYVTDLPPRAILDEVQRVPTLFTSLKLVIDADRVPGRFILTGSTNVLLLPRLGDSLAGRMSIMRLHPLTQVEMSGQKADFLPTLFQGSFRPGTTGRQGHLNLDKDRLRGGGLGRELAERITAGGYPPALARSAPSRRVDWYRDYAAILLQRDIAELARIIRLDDLPRLLQSLAGRTAQLLNISSLAASFQVSRPTIRAYLALLSQVFQLEELRAWHSNRHKRLVKTPKLHVGDTGLACALLGLNADRLWADRALFGQLLETFVYQELRRQAGWYEEEASFSHFRDKDKVEVDLVLEAAGRLAGIEVKASATVAGDDFKGLRRLQAAAGKRFAAGIVLYDGDLAASFGDGMAAVPISRLWESH